MWKKGKYVAHEVIGNYAKDVEMNNIFLLNNHPYAQCGFRVENNKVVFYSYSTPIFRIGCDYLHEFFDDYTTGYYIEFLFDVSYSATTSKHVGYACSELLQGVSYHDLKRWQHELGYITEMVNPVHNLKLFLNWDM